MKTNAGINLRPWREEQRQRKQQQFSQLSFLALVMGLIISILLWQATLASISAVQEENQFIKSHLLQLDSKIADVAGLRKKHQQLLQRIAVIQKLQNNRPVTVELMEQLASSINNGIYLTAIQRKENQLVIKGYANSSKLLATWMRNLNEQSRFNEPLLGKLITDEKANLTRFDLLLPLQESE